MLRQWELRSGSRIAIFFRRARYLLRVEIDDCLSHEMEINIYICMTAPTRKRLGLFLRIVEELTEWTGSRDAELWAGAGLRRICVAGSAMGIGPEFATATWRRVGRNWKLDGSVFGWGDIWLGTTDWRRRYMKFGFQIGYILDR